MVRHKNPPVVHNWGRKTVAWRSSSRPRTSQGYRNLITVESIADVVVLVKQKENLGSLFRIAIVIEIQKIVGAFSPNSGIIVEKCFIYL